MQSWASWLFLRELVGGMEFWIENKVLADWTLTPPPPPLCGFLSSWDPVCENDAGCCGSWLKQVEVDMVRKEFILHHKPPWLKNPPRYKRGGEYMPGRGQVSPLIPCLYYLDNSWDKIQLQLQIIVPFLFSSHLSAGGRNTCRRPCPWSFTSWVQI